MKAHELAAIVDDICNGAADAEIKVEVVEFDGADAAEDAIVEGDLLELTEGSGGWRQEAGCYVLTVTKL